MFVLVRMRGNVDVRGTIQDTLYMLRLNRVNHCVVINDTPHNRGMIQMVKDYVAYGTIDAATLTEMLTNRGKLEGGEKLTNEYLSQNTDYSTIAEFAEAVCTGKASLKDVPGLKPVFRLHPPRKGHAGIKKPVELGGVLGNHGENIKVLLNQMR